MKSDFQLLQDMLSAIAAIESYEVQSYNTLQNDPKTRDAVLHNLVILGKAANHLSESFRDEHSHLPWSSMIGTRNIIVHGYDQIKLSIVWDILRNDLQSLKNELQKLH
jgi:uncharacterized protein with HEPN domain